MNLFYSKLSSLRTQLRKWSKEEFGNIFDRVKSAAETYKQREAEFDSRGDESSKLRLHEVRTVYLRELSVAYSALLDQGGRCEHHFLPFGG